MNLFPSIYASKALGLPLVLGLALSACDGGVLPDDMSSASIDSPSSEAPSSDTGVSSVTVSSEAVSSEAVSSEAVASESSSLIVAVSSMVASSSSVVSVSSSPSFSSVAESSSVVPVSSSQASTISSAESSAAVSSAAVSSDAVSSEAVSSDAVSSETLSSEALSSEAASSVTSSIASSSSSAFSSSSSSALPVDCEVSDTRFDLNDVSFLFPLPTSDEELELLLDFDSPGLGGQLATLDQQEGMLEVLLTADAAIGVPQMRIMGVRIDPCAKGHEGKECTKELRLVGQPVGKPGDIYKTPLNPSPDALLAFTEITAMNYFGHDQVLHFIYELTDQNFDLLSEDLRQLKTLAKSETSCVPMNIHPVMAKQGLGGEYATFLKGIVQRYAGEANLDRAAFTAARTANFWFFRMREWDQETAAYTTISDTPQFAIRSGATHEDHIVGSFDIEDDSLLETLIKIEDQTGSEQVLFNGALQETLAIDNPNLTNPETVGCVECHAGQRLREKTINDPRFTVDEQIWGSLYDNPRYDLSAIVNDGHSIGSMRMFGYMNVDPHISIRVINDSAESADRLNAQ